MRKIVFDIETRNSFEEAGTSKAEGLDISVVCIHDSETNEYTSYLQEDLPKLWPILESADMLIGYNSDHFDIPLLNKYYAGDLTEIKSLDILKEIQKSIGHRVKLDDVAAATLGVGKSAHGLQAITWWKAGEIQKIIDYCIQDVKVTKEVYDYAMEHQMLKYSKGGVVTEMSIDTTSWEKKEGEGLAPTLGF